MKALTQVLVLGILVLALTTPALAKHRHLVDPPTLSGDCASSTLVTGSTDLIGAIIVDPVNLWGGSLTCTLTFPTAATNRRVCTATNETNGGGFPIYMGTRMVDTTHTILGSQNGEVGNDVISYQCATF